MRSCNRPQRRICTKKRESVSLVQRRERRSERVYLRADKEGIYKTVKITTNNIHILCRKER